MTKGHLRQIFLLTITFLGISGVIYFVSNAHLGSSHKSLDLNDIEADEDYFSGKTIEWIIPFKEGGGSDTWARFNAQFLTKFLPGNPSIIVSNVPGGGSIKGANLFAKRVKSDGLMIMGTSGSTQMPYLLDDPRVQYDYADFKPLWTYPTGGVVYISSDLGIKDASEIKGLLGVPLIYASQGPTSLDIVPAISFELLGLNVRTIFGFRGRGAGRLAFERGEVKIDYQTSSAYLKNVLPLVQSGEAVPLWSWGVLDKEGALIRDPSFPNLPHFGEVYEIMHNQAPNGLPFRSWFATMAAGFGGMKLVLVPKDTPNEIVKLYHKAILQMKRDPEYLAKKEKAIGLYDQVIGKQASIIFELATKIAPEEKEWCKDFLRQKHGLKI